jgi:hypothetical protein
MKATYTGPYDEVELVNLGRSWTVAQGDEIDLPDDVAASLEGRADWELSANKNTGRKATTQKDGEQ